jgi:hypothetical protein
MFCFEAMLPVCRGLKKAKGARIDVDFKDHKGPLTTSIHLTQSSGIVGPASNDYPKSKDEWLCFMLLARQADTQTYKGAKLFFLQCL